MSMMDDKKMEVVALGENNTRPFITVFHSYCWVALGTYYNKTGGMDTFKNNGETYKALMYALNHYPDYDILMEGIMASTIYSTYLNWFREVNHYVDYELISERKVLIVNFLPPVKTCIERVYERNGGKPVKEDQIQSKWNTVRKNADKFKEDGLLSIKINTAKCPKDKMLINFLKTCDKYREVTELI